MKMAQHSEKKKLAEVSICWGRIEYPQAIVRVFALDAQSKTIHMQKKSREQYFNGCFKWPFLPTNVIYSCV